MSHPTPPSKPRRIACVFSGGPAPGANAVISAAASAARRAGADFVGLLNGYSALATYSESDAPLVEDRHYRVFRDRDLWGLRNSRGICIGTARTNPSRAIQTASDLDDPEKTAGLACVHRGLVDLGVDGLISIGGDGTLRTAHCLWEYQRRLPSGERRIPIVHVPKTIDNDYHGIDFTFGFFTAVDVTAQELLNLRADAVATRSYFIVETMGRRAGWLAYAAAIAGEAHMVVGVEDVTGLLATKETVVDAAGTDREEKRLDVEALADRIVQLIEQRARGGKEYGTVVLSEGLAELLPERYVRGIQPNEQGFISLSKIDVGRLLAGIVSERYRARFGHEKKITGVQLGYESRCSAPHAFDVLLGCQLGLGAFSALAEHGLDGHMVSVTGQLALRYVAFSDLVDPVTLRTTVRFIEPGSDFHRMAQSLATRLGPAPKVRDESRGP